MKDGEVIPISNFLNAQCKQSLSQMTNSHTDILLKTITKSKSELHHKHSKSYQIQGLPIFGYHLLSVVPSLATSIQSMIMELPLHTRKMDPNLRFNMDPAV